MKLKREVYHGDVIPKFYGVAYPNPVCDSVICYPIPLNIMVRIAVMIWWQLRGGYLLEMEKRLWREARKKEKKAWIRGFQYAMKETRKSIGEAIDETLYRLRSKSQIK